jgi:hypothetical protein
VARFVALAMKVAIVFFFLFKLVLNKKATILGTLVCNVVAYRVSKGLSLGTLSLLARQYRSVLLSCLKDSLS